MLKDKVAQICRYEIIVRLLKRLFKFIVCIIIELEFPP